MQVAINRDLKMFLSGARATLALPIPDFTSASVPPCRLMMLPRYGNVSTSSRRVPLSIAGSVLAFAAEAEVLRLLPGAGDQGRVILKTPGRPAVSGESAECHSSLPLWSRALAASVKTR